MDFSQIRDRIAKLCELAGYTDAMPPASYATFANDGLRQFTQEAQHNVEDKTITTVASQVEYSLTTTGDPRNWVCIFDDATYGTTTPIYQTTRNDLRTGDRLWRQRASGVPGYWYWTLPGKKVGLYPTPSTSSITCYFQGVRHEPVMDEDTDEPLVPEVFHEGICLYGAWMVGKLYARGEDRGIFEGYLAEAKDYAARCKLNMASQEAPLIIRRVARPEQEYLGMGSKSVSVYVP